jgi:hypothetical protein
VVPAAAVVDAPALAPAANATPADPAPTTGVPSLALAPRPGLAPRPRRARASLSRLPARAQPVAVAGPEAPPDARQGAIEDQPIRSLSEAAARSPGTDDDAPITRLSDD